MLPPIGHHDFGFHDRQKENYERRRVVRCCAGDAVLVKKDRDMILLFFFDSFSTFLVMGK